MQPHSADVRMSLHLPCGREINVSHSGLGYLRVRGENEATLGPAVFRLSVDGSVTDVPVQVRLLSGPYVWYTRKDGE